MVSKRLLSTQKRFNDLHDKIAGYEEKYQQSYEEFPENIPDTIEGHDDWIDWTYLAEVTLGLAQKLKKFNMLTGQ